MIRKNRISNAVFLLRIMLGATIAVTADIGEHSK